MRLNQVTVAATSIPESIAFYETLGLKLIVRADHYARFELPEGGSTPAGCRTCWTSRTSDDRRPRAPAAISSMPIGWT